MSPPSIVVVLTDQHRFDHVGWMPGSPVRTATLDGLAAAGTVFTDAYACETRARG